MHLFQKYIENKCSPEELAELKEWLNTVEGAQQWEHFCAQLWDETSISTPLNASAIGNSWQHILKNTELNVETNPVQHRIPFKWFNAAAAAILILIGTIIFIFSIPGKWNHLQTAYGERRSIRLPDGSSITLNANSAIDYRGDWSDGREREVWLHGEGFFDVVHRADDKRFIVHLTDSSEIVVLGTAFNVHQGNKTVDIVLERGKIIWKLTGGERMVMAPGEKISYTLNKSQITKQKVNAFAHSDWTKGVINLEGMNVKEVTTRMQELYGWTFSFEGDSLARQRLWGTLPIDDPELLLAALAHAAGVKITRDKQQVLIQHK